MKTPRIVARKGSVRLGVHCRGSRVGCEEAGSAGGTPAVTVSYRIRCPNFVDASTHTRA